MSTSDAWPIVVLMHVLAVAIGWFVILFVGGWLLIGWKRGPLREDDKPGAERTTNDSAHQVFEGEGDVDYLPRS